MFKTLTWLVWCVALVLMACSGPEERPTDGDGLCDEVDCSGHGTCVSPEGEPVCICHRGYERRELRCVPSGADGDGDVDSDSDSDSDSESCAGGCDPGDRCDPVSRECVPGVWVTIEAGTFDMGSPESEAGREPDEELHSVTLTRDFEVWSVEVTIAEFSQVMGYHPSIAPSCTTECSVDNVTWHEAAAYCNALSSEAGLPSCYRCSGEGDSLSCGAAVWPIMTCEGYRLPTEAEWEYAARGGTTTSTYNGDLDPTRLGCEQPNPVLDPIAWFCGSSGRDPQPVGQLRPNAFGLYDMLGSVYEWCNDGYREDLGTEPVTDPEGDRASDRKVVRGGSWYREAARSRAARRTNLDPDEASQALGFRPVRTLRE
jgi:formylglycine-generating enzyme required for sulfatase activity